MSKKQHLLNKKLGWSLDERDPKFIESLMPLFGFLYHYYFRVQTSGWENIPPQQKVLLVGSHNGGLAAPDMAMMMYDWFRRFGVEKPVYGLMHPKAWQVSTPLAQMAAKAGAIIAHPKMAYTALRSGASVLVYPGGAEDVFRPHYLRNKIYLAGRQGFIKLALRENVPIVPVISWGAHDTLIVIADCYKVVQQLHEWGMPWLLGIDPEVFPIYLGLPWGLAIGPLPNIPLPVPIYTRVCPPIVFERYGREAASDRYYVDKCYELVVSQMQQELDNLIKLTAKTNSL
ncbi:MULTISPECIES: lysophospholipid acyltransferase family protein [unclassified Nostoc]|uniref:lysophospholipid acyltransferase family protein n=1 Tax=unclassified Nostoc TaxID=2593658 RepID=UPI001DA7DDE0|nr:MULTISPECIES: lysophospholipid acyltransferase family protein [unclassified Nostoc]MBN3875983.1 acyltransferase family protein [Nostoc sp. JL23]MBN3889254.1 acyltransferase family protein [Nostoc sp. JL31]